jgi:pterin-4a-carbinolamine dehydratase
LPAPTRFAYIRAHLKAGSNHVGHRVFLSYRRGADAPRARNLAGVLQANLGPSDVFFDADSINEGDVWPARLDVALRSCEVVIALIGPSWLSATDMYHRRRIDLEGDWVRRELELAIERNVTVIPVLVGGAGLPTQEALPPSLARLAEFQAREMRDDSWKEDAEAFVRTVAKLLKPKADRLREIKWPKPTGAQPVPLTREQLAQILTDLPAWRVETSQILDDPRVTQGTKVELVRTFQFRSFVDVINFMSTAAPSIDAMDHHPRWENVWRTLIVRVTTWDIGHQLSDRDSVLARYLERLYKDLDPSRRR